MKKLLLLLILCSALYQINGMEKSSLPYVSAKELAKTCGQKEALVRAQIGFENKDLLQEMQAPLNALLQVDDTARLYVWNIMPRHDQIKAFKAAQVLSAISGSYDPIKKVVYASVCGCDDIIKKVWSNIIDVIDYQQAWQVSIDKGLKKWGLGNLFFEPQGNVIEYYNMSSVYIDMQTGEFLSKDVKESIPDTPNFEWMFSYNDGDVERYIMLDSGDKVGCIAKNEHSISFLRPYYYSIIKCTKNGKRVEILPPKYGEKDHIAKGLNTVICLDDGSVYSAEGTLLYTIEKEGYVIDKQNRNAVAELEDYFVVNMYKKKESIIEGNSARYVKIGPALFIFKKNQDKTVSEIDCLDGYDSHVFRIGNNKVLVLKNTTDNPDQHSILDLSGSKIQNTPFNLPDKKFKCHPIVLQKGLWGMLVRIDAENANKVVFQLYTSDYFLKEFELCNYAQLGKKHINQDFQLCTIDSQGKVYVGWRGSSAVHIASYKPISLCNDALMSKSLPELEQLAQKSGATKNASADIMSLIKDN